MQEHILTGRIAGLVIFRLPEFGTRASFSIECAGRGPVICCIAGDVAREFVTHQGDIVVVNGSYEARPSTAPAKSRWAGRFHVRAVLGSARHPLSGMWGVEASELREVAKSPLESDRSIISGF
jgi:hypothetical protein